MPSKLTAFLHRERNGTFSLYACRGHLARCVHKRDRRKKCSDCVRGLPEETIEQLMKRIEQGDA